MQTGWRSPKLTHRLTGDVQNCRCLHLDPKSNKWATTFTPFGVLLTPAETAFAHTYALLALTEAAKRVLDIEITIAGQSTDAHAASLKTTEVFEMKLSTICFPHVLRRVRLTHTPHTQTPHTPREHTSRWVWRHRVPPVVAQSAGRHEEPLSHRGQLEAEGRVHHDRSGGHHDAAPLPNDSAGRQCSLLTTM
jgi:hypothetical protein